MNKYRIFLSDDHAILRDGLKHIITSNPDYEVIGESGDGRDALEKIEKMKPDIVILDISMPSMTGVEVARNIKKYNPNIKIIILTQYDSSEYIKQLLKYGVEGYILKENASDELLRAIGEVQKGNNFLSPEITKKVVTDFKETGESGKSKELKTQFSLLSPREREILKLIADGNSNVQIASILFISDQTVKTHRANIMKKLDIHNLAELIKFAMKDGLIE